MRSRIQAAIIVLILMTLLLIVLPALLTVRDLAARSHCQNNLHALGLALQNYHSCYAAYPRGTVAGSNLPPERRLSVYAELVNFVEGGYRLLLDPLKPWDDEANSPIWADCKAFDSGGMIRYEKQIVRELRYLLCPANPNHDPLASPCFTDYVGMAGEGADAATWPLNHPGAGVFGYDRAIQPSDIKDGESNTLALIETAVKSGPWTAGGLPTVRGLDPHGPSYFGRNGQFTAFHRQINAAFLDGTVRNLSPALDPHMLEAFATFAGGEEVP